jgi:type I restriction enzyme S subunit
MTQLRSFPMPVPSFNEQREILAKLKELTYQAHQWRMQLEKKQNMASLLASTTVASFTGIATEKEYEESAVGTEAETTA